MDRRKFVKRPRGRPSARWAAGGCIRSSRPSGATWRGGRSRVPNLPPPFRGTTVALLADVHHGPYVPLDYIRHVVRMTNALRPDIVALAGDYVHPGRPTTSRRGSPSWASWRPAWAGSRCRGNHDNREYAPITRDALAEAKLPDLNNTGVWLERRGARLRIGGVGDLWTDRQDLGAALGDATLDDAVILLSHNPDFVESIRDRRVGLVLSGHTHGGQVVVPGFGAPIVPSQYGQKYLHGLVQGPACPGVRHPGRRHHHPARPLPLPARGRPDHAASRRPR